MEKADAGKAEELLRRYAHSLEMANYSPRTIREYRKIVRQWIRTSSNGTLRVDPEELDAWVAAMYGRGLQPGTIATRITVLRAFLGWAVEEGAIESNPAAALPKVRLGRRLPKAMTRAEVRRFMAAVLAEGGTHAQRDHVLFSLMYTCGLRISEVVGLQVEDFDPECGVLQVCGKGDQERSVDLRPADVAMLEAWVGQKRRGWLFPGQDGDHLSTRVVQHHCRRYRKAAGITRRVTPHTFRHSCAVHNLTSGAPITYVQQRLGHANLAVTGIYTQLVDRERARITRETELAI